MIDFIILHYQAIDETMDCINTIQEKVTGDKRIIVIDNCSPNGTGKQLETHFKGSSDVQIMLIEQNLGFAKGNNIGFRKAKKDNPDFIVVMNNDVFIEQDDFTERVFKSYEDNHFAIMGPDIYSTKVKGHQNPQRINNYTMEELKKVQKKLIFKNKFKWLLKIKYLLLQKEREVEGPELIDKKIENVVLHGACYIFSKDFISKHDNCFFNETFMYFESYILHYLSQKEKCKMLYDPSIKVLHHEDVATNQTYKSMYKKSVFVNRCLLESCNVFIKVMKDKKVRLN